MANLQTAARDRILKLLDSGSFVEIGAYITARADAGKPEAKADGDGVITGYGTVNGCLVYVFSQNSDVNGGSIGEMHAKKISNIYSMAVSMGAPVIALISSAGVRMNESNDSLYSFGRIYKHQAEASGVVPQVYGIFGPCGGGLAVSAAMADFVYMDKENGKLFLNSPNAVTGNYTEKCDTSSAVFQAEETGVVDAIGSEDEIIEGIRDLVSVLPSNNEEDLSADITDDDLNRAVAGIESMKDKSEMIKQISDNGKFIELKKEYSPSMAAGFIRINGRTVGVLANKKPQLCPCGCTKAVKFLKFCDAFNIPVLTLADVEGFAKKMTAEQRLGGLLGQLTALYATATVPMVTVVTGSAYGTAGIAMGSKAVGADIVYAWTGAKMGLMDADILDSIGGNGAANTALANAQRGYVDDIIAPAETRQRVAAAFEMLYTKNVAVPVRKHGTI